MDSLKKRGSYGRPCDLCASRRVRCEVPTGSSLCTKCTALEVPCTRDRIRLKSGPKNGRRSRRETEKKKDVSRSPRANTPVPVSLPANLGLSPAPRPEFPDKNLFMAFSDSPQVSPNVHFSPYTPQPRFNAFTPALTQPVEVFPQKPLEELDIPNALEAFTVKPEKRFQSDSPHAQLSLEHLLLRLQVYQTWFYGYWPILSVAELILVILDGAQLGYEDNFITLNSKNAMSYGLCCAVCAAITTQLSFVLSTNSSLNCNAILANAYANEAKRVRELFEYRDNPDMNSLLISFFLYAHFVNTPGRTKTATIYLREAISIGQVLMFHSPEFYRGKTRAEIHRWRKIYYTLLVTERYMCFECGIPGILEPCVQYPDLDDEEYPSLIYGFTELVKVFSAPGKNFFGEYKQRGSPEMEQPDKRRWITAVQLKLKDQRDLPKNVTHSQRVNIILSEAWIRAIAWQITADNGMLHSLNLSDDYFSYNFPLFNARSFLGRTRDLPEVAFETNGPGVYVKLLELATTLTSSIPKIAGESLAPRLQDLESLFSLVTKFKNDITIKLEQYQRIGNFIFQSKMREVPRSMNSQIEELDDEDCENVTENDLGLTFFQSMNSLKNFGTLPKFGSNISLSAFMHHAPGDNRE